MTCVESIQKRYPKSMSQAERHEIVMSSCCVASIDHYHYVPCMCVGMVARMVGWLPVWLVEGQIGWPDPDAWLPGFMAPTLVEYPVARD